MEKGNAFAFAKPAKSGEDVVKKLKIHFLNPEDTRERYKFWASQYNHDFEISGWQAPKIGAEAVNSWLENKQARILDAGAGTGLCGQELAKCGYENIDGVDASAEMLEVARTSGAYTNLEVNVLGKDRLPFQDDAFDVTVCVGVIGPTHVDESCFPEFIRVTKPGGFVVLVIREYNFKSKSHPGYLKNLEPEMARLQDTGVWKIVESKVVENYHGPVSGRLFVLQML